MSGSEDERTIRAAHELREAWDALIESLSSARDAIDDPALMPPPASPRGLAEGYRYLLGFVHSAIERAFHADPARPVFRNALSILNRATIDNADAIYFYAPIDGRTSTVIRGRATPGARGGPHQTEPGGRRSPHYVIFEASSGGLAGDTGDLRELAPGARTQTGRLDSKDLQLDSDGYFEILLAPSKPAGYAGNFIQTLKVVGRPHPLDPETPPERFATFVSGRQLFYDWEHEEAIHLAIEPAGDIAPPAPYDPAHAAAELRRCGALVRGQMHFWNAFWTVPMGAHGHREGGIPGVEFPRNAFNRINAASGATGGGQSTNLYAGGVFDLGPQEALVVESRLAREPDYLGFQLGNLWGESIEYAAALGSLNGHQSERDPDGAIRWVVAHRDPGVPNWLDTTGHATGFLTPRWTYSETPPEEDWPRIEARKVPFDEIRRHLHPGTRSVTPAERQRQIRVRREHVQRRFRAF